MLGSSDGERRAREARDELRQDAYTLNFVQRRCRAHIKTELDTRIGGVDTLTTRSGSARKLLNQLFLRHPETTGCSNTGRHMQVIHTPSLPQPA